MVRTLALMMGFVLLALAEFACFQLLRHLGIPVPLAIVITTTFCVGTFCLFVGLFLMRADSASYTDVRHDRHDRYDTERNYNRSPNATSGERLHAVPVGRGTIPSYHPPSHTHRQERPILALPESTHTSPEYAPPPSGDRHRTVGYEEHYAPPVQPYEEDPEPAIQAGWDAPTGDAYAPQLVQLSPEEMEEAEAPAVDPMVEELRITLEAQHKSFTNLMAQAQKELGRFDVHVLKSLERNQQGSVDGVLVARKIMSAVETRIKDIEKILGASRFDMGKAILLANAELEIPDDKLTSTFKTKHIEPIKITEVEFHLRVLLKRIGRRRSIFKGPMTDLGQLS